MLNFYANPIFKKFKLFLKDTGNIIENIRIINMSLKHLKAGSEMPPLKEGKLRLYSMVFCPYAQRTRLILAAKNIP